MISLKKYATWVSKIYKQEDIEPDWKKLALRIYGKNLSDSKIDVFVSYEDSASKCFLVKDHIFNSIKRINKYTIEFDDMHYNDFDIVLPGESIHLYGTMNSSGEDYEVLEVEKIKKSATIITYKLTLNKDLSSLYLTNIKYKDRAVSLEGRRTKFQEDYSNGNYLLTYDHVVKKGRYIAIKIKTLVEENKINSVQMELFK